jgi:hypothetical protein
VVVVVVVDSWMRPTTSCVRVDQFSLSKASNWNFLLLSAKDAGALLNFLFYFFLQHVAQSSAHRLHASAHAFICASLILSQL